jgi:hypothetical protein
MLKGSQLLYINDAAAVRKTRILQSIAAAQCADTTDLGHHGSAKEAEVGNAQAAQHVVEHEAPG